MCHIVQANLSNKKRFRIDQALKVTLRELGTNHPYGPHSFTGKGSQKLFDLLKQSFSAREFAIRAVVPTLICLVTVKSPRISPWMTLAVVLCAASVVFAGRIASP